MSNRSLVSKHKMLLKCNVLSNAFFKELKEPKISLPEA